MKFLYRNNQIREAVGCEWIPDVRFPSSSSPIKSDPTVLRAPGPRPSTTLLHLLSVLLRDKHLLDRKANSIPHKIQTPCPQWLLSSIDREKVLRQRTSPILALSALILSPTPFQYIKTNFTTIKTMVSARVLITSSTRTINVDHRRIRGTWILHSTTGKLHKLVGSSINTITERFRRRNRKIKV